MIDNYKNMLSSKNLTFNKLKSNKLIIAFIIFALLSTASVVGIYQQQKNAESTPEKTPNEQDSISYGNEMILYGYLRGNETIIEGFNLLNASTYEVATIPNGVKNISSISESELLFISNVDEGDLGDSLSTYSLSSKNLSSIYTPPDDFRIDLYTISPSKNLVAVWQVALDQQSGTLDGGKSQVVVIELLNGQSTSPPVILLDEKPNSSPISFPVAITDDGNVFVDKFLPNSGISGWQKGLSAINYKTLQSRDIPSAIDGSYSSQPILSPDQKTIAFVGYDGSKGDGKKVSSGVKLAQATSNTINLVNTQTLENTVAVISENLFFDNLNYSQDGNKLFYTSYEKGGKKLNNYSLLTQAVESSEYLKDPSMGILGATNESAIIGLPIKDAISIGSLGKIYAPSIQEFTNYKISGNISTILPVLQQRVQFIELLPSRYLKNLATIDDNNRLNLQLDTFTIRPQLVEKRTSQIVKNPATTPPDKFSGTPDCDDPKWYYTDEQIAKNDLTMVGDYNAYTRWHNSCLGSPLYVYGQKGQTIEISINTRTYNSVPFFNSSLKIEVGDNDTMIVEGKPYDKISYDYIGSKPYKRPSTGRIIERERLAQNIIDIGEKLGLTKKEIDDLIDEMPQPKTDKIFVSFLSQHESKQILPLIFNIKPDTYINYIFYIEELNSNSMKIATNDLNFPKIPERKGLTVVETSFIAEFN